MPFQHENFSLSMDTYTRAHAWLSNTIPAGPVPYDGVPLKENATYHTAVTVIFMLLACAGIALAVVCLIFNFIYRKSKYDYYSYHLYNYKKS